MAKSNKNSNKQVDAPCGYVYKTFDDKVEIDFAYKQKINQTQSVERFSEIEVLNFVARSYEESCLKLLQEMGKYNKADDDSIRRCMKYYLPAMFAFRHYLELRLKTMYMDYQSKSFDYEHTLSKIYEYLEQETSRSFPAFKEAIDYVEGIEKSISGKPCDEFFRYLIDTNFASVKKLDIPMFEAKKVAGFIEHIEREIIMMRVNSMSTNQ